jgi:hypothetical protein
MRLADLVRLKADVAINRRAKIPRIDRDGDPRRLVESGARTGRLRP